MNNLAKFTDYTKGLLQEQGKKYTQAIHSYRLAILQPNKELSDVYYRLAYLLDRKKLYEEACEYFLLMNDISFKIDKNSNRENRENEKLLDQYLLDQYLLDHEMNNEEEWLDFSKNAEALKCWSVASYAYGELTHRSENFNAEYYKALACSFLQEKKYKEASRAFKEQKKIQSIDTWIDGKERDTYQEYFQRFSVEERIVVYESDDEISDRVYELYLYLDKDAHFDAYRHVWVVEDKESFIRTHNNVNSIVIQKDSDLHKRYLAKAKYIISNKRLSAYYQRKPQQYLISTESSGCSDVVTHVMNKEMRYYDIVQEVFFGNGTVAWNGEKKENVLSRFYSVAVEEFNNKKWKNAHQKFLEVKRRAIDIKYQLPTEYYIYESKFQMDVNKKSIDSLLIYDEYKLSSKNFAGIDYILFEASKNSLDNEKQWQELKDSFLEIVEDIKKNSTVNIRAIKDKNVLIKIEKFSKIFNNNLEAELLSYKAWFLFSHLFIFARLYQKYELAREKALFSVLSKNGSSRYHLSAMAETNDRAGYNTLKKKLLNGVNQQQIKEKLQFLGATELYFNRHDLAIEFYKKNYTEDEKLFANYIKGKTIAIVGPLTSNLNLGEEIDNYDVVLRFNYQGLDKNLKASHGTKTNLSFYILEILIKDRINASQVEYMNQLDWAIFDTGHNKNSVCFAGVKSNLRPRYYDAHNYANPYFKGTANGIQRVLLDLLRFDTGKIKIYNSNLFLENSYEKKYKSRGSLGADHFNFIWHDPLSNFIFLKRLKEFNIIESDDVLTKILRLTSKEYIFELDKRYGK